ncbi:hypothetical protein ACHAXR_007181 [Thalassiosira sp. AJA248-18]
MKYLQPKNEFGTEKFVCTYIQPTILPFAELNDAKSCARFIAHYVVYEPLLEDTSAHEIVVVSPAQTMEWAIGDCFDCSFLLVSLLIGAGYDAFVVLGTAPEWIRLKDQSHMQCALTQQDDDDISTPWSAKLSITDESYAQKGSRNSGVHCWVLVKTGGKRDLVDGRHMFVDPSTGVFYPVGDSPYPTVLSIWNDRNCWVNIGNDSIRDDEEFDLNCVNDNRWMPVIPAAHSTPFSWVSALDLPKERFDLRYHPDGKRNIKLNKAKVELFGEDIDPQGVVSRVIKYEDTAQTIVVGCTEQFGARRKDHLMQRIRRPMENLNHEFFSSKNEMSERKEMLGLRCIKFREKTRADGLVKRLEEIGSSVTEHFLNRADKLERREIYFSLLPKDAKKSQKMSEWNRIDEYFKAPEDTSELAVASRSYLLKELKVRVAYHCEHEVLQRVDVYHKDEITKDGSRGKELLQLENASITEVKRTQTEMIRLNESKYGQEMKILVSSSSGTSSRHATGEVNPPSEDEVMDGRVIDYLSPYLGVENQGSLPKVDAMRVKQECLQDTKERLLERADVIRSKLDHEKQQYQEMAGHAEADVQFRINLLEKRLAEHESKAILKYKDLEKKLQDDIRLASLHESE